MSRLLAFVASLLIIGTAAVTLAPAAGAQQAATGTVTLNLYTCHVEGSADGITITQTFTPGDRAVDRDCVNEWQPRRGGAAHFTLNGQASDGGDGTTTVSWSGLATQTEYTLIGDAGAMNPFVFTLPISGHLTFSAVLYKFYTPTETPVATVPSSGATGGLTEDQLTGNTVTTTGDVNLRATPDGAAQVLTLVPGGSVVTLRIDQVDTVTGASGTRWWPVSYNGQDGWIDGAYLAPVASGGTGGAVTTLPQTGSGAAQARATTGPILALGVLAVLALGLAWLSRKRGGV